MLLRLGKLIFFGGVGRESWGSRDGGLDYENLIEFLHEKENVIFLMLRTVFPSLPFKSVLNSRKALMILSTVARKCY